MGDNLKINFISFGKKYHESNSYDLLLDARCLINPYYEEELKNFNGLDSRVFNYIYKENDTKEYLDLLTKYLSCYFKLISKKKDKITVGVMCTGGMHRSVFLASYLYKYYQNDYECEVSHLDS